MPGKDTTKTTTCNVIGLMSGTSLDGLDLAYCKFTFNKGWEYNILAAKTYPYTSEWREKLSAVEKKSSEELAALHSEYGHFIGKAIVKFLTELSFPRGLTGKRNIFISSHGHTIFHQPERKFTFQLGNGAAIAAECNFPVVCDFRSNDVALGGQGAPLVPIGDKLLFPEFDFCLNIGGIANISFDNPKGERLAYDICPANIVLNYLAATKGKVYDKNGEIARAGSVSKKLLKVLDSLNFYSKKPPRSLGKEWIMKYFYPVLNRYNISPEDKMRTVVEHIAIQINSQLVQQNKTGRKKLLITGGGAHNKFLVERIKANSFLNIIIPEKITIDFKEALIFAFLGVLRIRNEVNCLSSVTGAKKDNCGGAIYLP